MRREDMLRLADLAKDSERYHIVVSLINGIGDAFLALPLIRYICELFGNEHVTVWGRPRYARTVFSELGSMFLSVGIESDDYPKREIYTGSEIQELKERLRIWPNICWVSLNSYFPRRKIEEQAIAEIQPKFFWGFRPHGVRTQTKDGSLFHRRDQYFRVIGDESAPVRIRRTPSLDSTAMSSAQALKRAAEASAKSLVAIQIETNDLGKRWPIDYWIKLGRELKDNSELVLVGHLADELPMEIEQIFSILPDDWNLQISAVASADVFVGIDSCFAHIADSFDIAGVVLFGPTSSVFDQWRPLNPGLKPLLAANGDLKLLSPDEVLGAVKPLCGRCLGV